MDFWLNSQIANIISHVISISRRVVGAAMLLRSNPLSEFSTLEDIP